MHLGAHPFLSLLFYPSSKSKGVEVQVDSADHGLCLERKVLGRGSTMSSYRFLQLGKVCLAQLALALLCVCSLSKPEAQPGRHEDMQWRCPPLPSSLQQSDLVGTWQSRYFPRSVTDTLILREDGTFQQILENDLTSFYYASLWNEWYLEWRPTGGLLLHLRGMRYCLSTDEICRRPEGGGGEWHYYDPCEDRSLTMGNEVILAVVGGQDPRYSGIEVVPRGILLQHMRASTYSSDAFFVLTEEPENHPPHDR